MWTRPSLTSNRSAKSASTCDLDRTERGLLAEVLDLEVFAHPAPDVTAAEQHEVRVGVALRRMPAQHEHAAERIGRGRGERLGRQPVQRAAHLGEEARVAEEQALRARGIDLARAARDAERGALDERDDAVGTRVLALALVVQGSGIAETLPESSASRCSAHRGPQH